MPRSLLLVRYLAPKVYEAGVPWDDPSGAQLRKWLGVSNEIFYDESKIALSPMGFCCPGKGQGGDLPPRPECAPIWHQQLWDAMPHLELSILIGTFAQNCSLKGEMEKNLTETAKALQKCLSKYFPLPHPLPINRFWFTKNPWFDNEVVKDLQYKVKDGLER